MALLLLIHCLLLLPLCCKLCCISFDVWAYNVVYDLVIILCMFYDCFALGDIEVNVFVNALVSCLNDSIIYGKVSAPVKYILAPSYPLPPCGLDCCLF